MSSFRKEKLEELIKRIVSELIMKEIKDPRIGFATVTGVNLSKDKKNAKIGISIFGDASDCRKTFEGLKSAQSYIQHRLGKNLMVRNTPKIEFFLDPSVAKGVNMVDFLDKIPKTGTENNDVD